MVQDRMHLDCCFSILGDDVCLMMEEMMGADSLTKRLVDEWSRDEATGGYNLTRQDVEFSEFMEGEGYKIVPIKAEHQLVSPTQHLEALSCWQSTMQHVAHGQILHMTHNLDLQHA